MTTTAQSTLPRTISPALFQQKPVIPAHAPVLLTGNVVQDGPNEGWIHCESDDGTSFLVAPEESGIMDWFDACATAKRAKAELPTKAQLDALYRAHKTGALKAAFNATGDATGPNSDGWYWSSTQDDNYDAWCQRFSDGLQSRDVKYGQASVRCVRRLTI